MPRMILAPFQKFAVEGATVGRLISRLLSQHLEIGLMHCVQMARGNDLDTVLKKMFRQTRRNAPYQRSREAFCLLSGASWSSRGLPKGGPARPLLPENQKPVRARRLVGRSQRQARLREHGGARRPGSARSAISPSSNRITSMRTFSPPKRRASYTPMNIWRGSIMRVGSAPKRSIQIR